MEELRLLYDLRPAPYNPREISDKAFGALKGSLEAFGDISGIVWNATTGHLVCGHQRLRALREQHGDKLELKGGAIVTPTGERFPVRIVEWDEMREKAANVAANNPHIASEFTPELDAILEELTAELPDLSEALRLDEIKIPKLSKRNDEITPIASKFELIIEFENEENLHAAYERYTCEGLSCRVLIY